MSTLTVTKVPRNKPKEPPSHWVGSPPTVFRNPWPSFRHKMTAMQMLRLRFGTGRNFVPVPENCEGLVAIQTPDWGAKSDAKPDQIKATWIGHSSFLIEMPAQECGDKKRGLRFLMDPVFCERMGPGQLIGPKRFSPTPCSIDDMPLVDAVCISHNHYDHLDIDAVKHLYADKHRKRDAAGMAPLHFFCGLNSKPWFVNHCGVLPEHVTEMDWWDEVHVSVADETTRETVRLVCTPTQHNSRRSANDLDHMLWCSFILKSQSTTEPSTPSPPKEVSIFFAGDTGYRSITDDDIAAGTAVADLPRCPAFSEIGDKYGPFDLALLPIGCYTPRTQMSCVHCSPEDSVDVHFDVRSKLSVGMHYGTVRGGISAQDEDVREPPQLWRKAGEARGLVWGKDFRLCNIGETVVV